MQDALQSGRARSIGVANYGVAHLEALFEDPHCEVKPAVNQIELSPFHPNRTLVDFCIKKGIVVMAAAPLTNRGALDDRRLKEIARKHGRTPCEVMLAWNRRKGYTCIPKASNFEHLAENLRAYGGGASGDGQAGQGQRKPCDWLTDDDMSWMETFYDPQDPLDVNQTSLCNAQAAP